MTTSHLAAMNLGGHSWEKAGPIWYSALPLLSSQASFQEAAQATTHRHHDPMAPHPRDGTASCHKTRAKAQRGASAAGEEEAHVTAVAAAVRQHAGGARSGP